MCVPCVYSLSVPAFSCSPEMHFTRREGTQRSPCSPTDGKGLSRAVEGLVFSCLRRAPSNLPTDLYFPLPLCDWTFTSHSLAPWSLLGLEFCRILPAWLCYHLGCLLLPNSFCSNPEQKEILLEGCWVLQQSVRNCRKSLAVGPEAGQFYKVREKQHNRHQIRKLWLCYRHCHNYPNRIDLDYPVFFVLFKIQSLEQEYQIAWTWLSHLLVSWLSGWEWRWWWGKMDQFPSYSTVGGGTLHPIKSCPFRLPTSMHILLPVQSYEKAFPLIKYLKMNSSSP